MSRAELTGTWEVCNRELLDPDDRDSHNDKTNDEWALDIGDIITIGRVPTSTRKMDIESPGWSTRIYPRLNPDIAVAESGVFRIDGELHSVSFYRDDNVCAHHDKGLKLIIRASHRIILDHEGEYHLHPPQ